MAFANIWLSVSDAAQAVIIESIDWPEDTPYTGPLRPRSRRLFTYMDDHATRRKLFTKPVLQGITYNLWSLEFDDEKETLQAVGDELDYLMGQYPAQIAVCGAWRWDGQQIRNLGIAVYPIPSWLWRFLPDPMRDGTSPTSNDDLHDVNLLQGQYPRDFTWV